MNTTQERTPWDTYFMNITIEIAKRSTCLRHQIGAVIVKNNIIVSSGFNGAPRGLPHCIETSCIRNKLSILSGTQLELCEGVHAEQNALLQAGKDALGATLYINAWPCKPCAKLIINAQIKRVVVTNSYIDDSGIRLLQHANIEVVYLKL